MADDVIQQIYQLSVDEAALAKLKKGIADGRKSIEQLTAAAKAQPVAFEEATKAATHYAASVEESQKKAASGSGFNFGVIGRGLNSVGLSAPAEVSKTVGDLQDLYKQFEANKDIIPGVAAASEALTPILGASAAGFAAVAAPVALVAASAIPLALAVKEVSDELERSRKAYQDELAALKLATDFKNQNITDARTKTAAQNRQEAEDQQLRIKNQQDYLEQLRKNREDLDKQYADLGAAFDPLKRKDLGDKASDVDKQIEEATQQLIKMAEQAQNTVLVLGPEIDAREADKKAIEDQTKATNDHVAMILQDAQTQARTNAEIRSLTSEQVAARLEAIDIEKKAIQDQIDQLSALPNRTDKVTATLQSLGTQMDTLSKESAGLSSAIGNLPADIKKQNDDKIAATKKYNDDVVKIEEQSAEARANAVGKYNDALVKAAETAADAAAAALDKLKDSRAKLAQDLANADGDAEKKRQLEKHDAEIKRQQEEVKSAREHQRNLEQIRKDGQKSEQEAIDNRDFMALFQARDNTRSQMEQENQRYSQEQQDRQEAYAQADKDRDEAFKRDQEARMVKYKRDLDAARDQYNKELAIAADNKNKAIRLATQARDNELNLLQSKLQTDLRLKLQAYDIELKNAQLSGQQRIQVEQQINDKLLQLANARLNSINAQSTSHSTATSTSGRVTPTKDFDNSSGRIRAGAGSSQSIGAGTGKGAVTINGPLVAPTINAGGANPAQLNGIQNMIFEGALQALQVVTGVQVNK